MPDIKNRALFYLLAFENLPIFEQLQIEEALVRADTRNWIIVNSGTSPAIVMGISGKQELLIDREKTKQQPIPIIRRFSGGGTVVVDEHTLFYTLIGNRSALDFPCYPNELMRLTEQLYLPAFEPLPFALRDHDYVIEDKKFGGNAQYLSKNRWLHHSSLLWDYSPHKMEYLLMPPKMPAYRQQRNHTDFLCTLKQHFLSQDVFKSKMLHAIRKKFTVIPTTLAESKVLPEGPHRRSTRLEEPGL